MFYACAHEELAAAPQSEQRPGRFKINGELRICGLSDCPEILPSPRRVRFSKVARSAVPGNRRKNAGRSLYRSEFAHHLAVVPSTELTIGDQRDILADESHGTIGHQGMNAAFVVRT